MEEKYRTVAEVIEYLKTFPQDYEVLYDYMGCDFFDCISVDDGEKEVYIGINPIQTVL